MLIFLQKDEHYIDIFMKLFHTMYGIYTYLYICQYILKSII